VREKGFRNQVERIFENIDAILREVGISRSNVTVGVNELPLGAEVEIEVTAVKK